MVGGQLFLMRELFQQLHPLIVDEGVQHLDGMPDGLITNGAILRVDISRKPSALRFDGSKCIRGQVRSLLQETFRYKAISVDATPTWFELRRDRKSVRLTVVCWVRNVTIEGCVALGDEVTVYPGVYLSEDVSVFPRLKLPGGIKIPPGVEVTGPADVLRYL